MADDEFVTVQLRPFFEAFQARNAAGDIDAVAQMYAPTIMVAGPSGASAVSAVALIGAIRQRKQLFDSLGCPPAALAGVSGMKLDERYALARTEWRFFLPPDREAVTLSSTFIIDGIGTADPRIVLYMNHRDLMAVLRDRGVSVG
jgi:hypothetical protein